jgi:hypothetical protein
MVISRRHVVTLAVVIAGAALAGGAAGHRASAANQASTATSACGVRLAAALQGEIAFTIPAGGRAVRRALARGFARCTLLRRDGTRFAELDSDAQHRFLSLAFYRRTGKLIHTSDATPAGGSNGSNVKCGSSSQASLGGAYWRTSLKWSIGTTPSGLNKDKVISSVRNAVSEWNNNINWCGIKDQANVPVSYQGTSSAKGKHDEKNTVVWVSLKNDQDCSGALACASSWYDGNGKPIESDIRFDTGVKWSTSGGSGAYDIQSVAAHEFGHVFQFGHVSNGGKNDQTNLMWPYVDLADTTGRKLGKGDATADNGHY